MIRLALLSFSILALAACGDRVQTSSGVKSDEASFQGVTGPGNVYNSPGWKPGDKTAWEQHLKTRLQNTQNEYNRIR